MATGESFRSLAFSFRISQSYISRIVRLVLKIVSERLTPILLPPPTKENLKQIAMDFWVKWNFPNCVGAIDRKHIRIFGLGKSGSLFFNYKDFFQLCYLQSLIQIVNLYLWMLVYTEKKGTVVLLTNAVSPINKDW